MQTDAWLVEHVEHARQSRSDLRRKANALRLTTRKLAVARSSVRYEAHIDHELQPRETSLTICFAIVIWRGVNAACLVVPLGIPCDGSAGDAGAAFAFSDFTHSSACTTGIDVMSECRARRR